METWRRRFAADRMHEPTPLGNPSRTSSNQQKKPKGFELGEDPMYTEPSLTSGSKPSMTRSGESSKGRNDNAARIRNPISHSLGKPNRTVNAKRATKGSPPPGMAKDDYSFENPDPLDIISSSQHSEEEETRREKSKRAVKKGRSIMEGPRKNKAGKSSSKPLTIDSDEEHEVLDLTSDDGKSSSLFPMSLTPRKKFKNKPDVPGIPMDLTPKKSKPPSPPSSLPIILTPTNKSQDDQLSYSQLTAPAPFPMQLTQVGFNLKRRAESPLSPEDINDDSGMETGSDQGMILVPATSSQSSADSPERSSQGEELFDEEDRVKKRLKSVTLEPPPIDYSTLCAFCDEPLPMNPSRSLQRLFEQIKPRARKQPRPTNPLGLTAPFTVYIQYCHNHRAEKNYIPDGLRRGWPKKIDFSAIRSRLQKPKNMKVLRMIVEGSGERAEWGKDGRGYFWDLAKYDVQSRGSRVANSVQGQMDTFETTQPGYYGEQGQMAISVAIDTLFPASTIAPASTSPLLLSDFRRRVLVPEAALLLIQEDMHAGRDEAMKIMNESRHYGLAMFPVRDTEEDFSLSLDNSLDVLSVEEKADHSLQHQVSDPLMTQNDEYLLPPARTPFKKDSPALLHDDAIQMADNRDSVLEGVNAHSLKVKKREPTSRPESEERLLKGTAHSSKTKPSEGARNSFNVEDGFSQDSNFEENCPARAKSTLEPQSNSGTFRSTKGSREDLQVGHSKGSDSEMEKYSVLSVKKASRPKFEPSKLPISRKNEKLYDENPKRKSKPTSSLFFDDPFESDDSSGVEDALHSVQHHIQVLETRSTAAKPSNPDTMISKSITRKGPSSSTPRGTDPERTARRTKMEKLAETRRKK